MDNDSIREKNFNTILNSAKQLFYEKGIEMTTVNEISQYSKISKVTIYKHFNSKVDIAVGVFKELFKNFYKEVNYIVFDKNYENLTGINQIERILEFYALPQEEDPKDYVFLVDLDMYLLRHGVQPGLVKNYDPFANTIKPYFVKAIKKGLEDKTIKDIEYEPEEFFEIVSASFRGVYMNYFLITFKPELDIENKLILKKRLEFIVNSVLIILSTNRGG